MDAAIAMGGFESPTTLDALWLAAAVEEQRMALAKELEALKDKVQRDAPKIELYQTLANTEELFNGDVISKIVSSGRTRLFRYLRKHGVLMSAPHRLNIPYQEHLDTGRFEVKVSTYRNRKTGKLTVKACPLFTGKGIIWLQQFIEKNGRDGL
ncbi:MULTISPECIES: phage antirepressor KilAC domain-containing protein [Pseudomonas]|uniref:Antirepressor protein C-terminal domain-containing protein n=1 Tax=Pseudomonas quercus TaxID=2722792 RepID=A0ABX0Y9G4_9PSED|nr:MULTISPECIES: phage antirepressor KilAC domain-containing protein [Pseudomonas]MBF7141429.1 phage antirepressor KilAC domain-containing protein [Pseudomonas sp. LY10J]NJO99967.1 hypothetical protein [Pseudomonas quercus]